MSIFSSKANLLNPAFIET